MVKNCKEGTGSRGLWGLRTETLYRLARQTGAQANGEDSGGGSS